MAVVSDIDIQDIEYVEEEGVIRRAVRKFLVTELTPTGTPTPQAQAFAASGIPQPGDKFPGNTNLAVRTRQYRVAPDSPTKAYVTVEYGTVADFANTFIFSGGASLQQKQTDVDYYGNRISLSYTYPNDYPNEELRGQVYTTAINETVSVPHLTMTATGSLYVEYPNEIALTWLNKVNSTFWAGAPPYYWLCTACNFRGRDIGLGRAHLWEFDWTFEFNPESWIVVAKIRDPNTGTVPDDVVDGVGVKTVDWYQPYDFNIIFGNT